MESNSYIRTKQNIFNNKQLWQLIIQHLPLRLTNSNNRLKNQQLLQVSGKISWESKREFFFSSWAKHKMRKGSEGETHVNISTPRNSVTDELKGSSKGLKYQMRDVIKSFKGKRDAKRQSSNKGYNKDQV